MGRQVDSDAGRAFQSAKSAYMQMEEDPRAPVMSGSVLGWRRAFDVAVGSCTYAEFPDGSKVYALPVALKPTSTETLSLWVPLGGGIKVEPRDYPNPVDVLDQVTTGITIALLRKRFPQGDNQRVPLAIRTTDLLERGEYDREGLRRPSQDFMGFLADIALRLPQQDGTADDVVGTFLETMTAYENR